MIYLLLSIVSSVLIAVVIRLNEDRDLDRSGVMFFNYLTATALAFIFMNTERVFYVSKQLIPISSVSGFIYVTAFMVYMKAVGRIGLAVPVTITRLSVLLPVLGSVLIFSERMSPHQVTGFILAVFAIYLFSGARTTDASVSKRSDMILLMLLFVLMGSGDFSLKVFQQLYPQAYLMNFVFLVFVIASLYTLVLVVIRKVRISRGIIAGGIILGIPNFASAFFILKVLQKFPGSIAFPLNNIGIIVLSTVVGRLFWRERLHRQTMIAVGLSILAVILLNMY